MNALLMICMSIATPLAALGLYELQARLERWDTTVTQRTEQSRRRRFYCGWVDELTDDVIAFLSEGTRTGMLGYLASDGRPLVAPVWFVVDGGELVFNTGKNTAKGRALARDPRVVMCVDDPRPPYSFVQVQGIASISEEPDDLLEFATRTGGRSWVPIGPRNTAGATASLGRSWFASSRPRCARRSTWRTDF